MRPSNRDFAPNRVTGFYVTIQTSGLESWTVK